MECVYLGTRIHHTVEIEGRTVTGMDEVRGDLAVRSVVFVLWEKDGTPSHIKTYKYKFMKVKQMRDCTRIILQLYFPQDGAPTCQIRTKYYRQRNRVRVESHRNCISQIGKIFHFRNGEQSRTPTEIRNIKK